MPTIGGRDIHLHAALGTGPFDPGAVAAFAASMTERSRGTQAVAPTPALVTGCRIFSASIHQDRLFLGDRVTVFLDTLRKGGGELADYQVRQSSDMGYHCLSIILFYQAPAAFVRA